MVFVPSLLERVCGGGSSVLVSSLSSSSAQSCLFSMVGSARSFSGIGVGGLCVCSLGLRRHCASHIEDLAMLLRQIPTLSVLLLPGVRSSLILGEAQIP